MKCMAPVGFRLSIVHRHSVLNGVFCRDKDLPEMGLLQSDLDYYAGIHPFFQLVPNGDIPSICIEGDRSLLRILQDPT